MSANEVLEQVKALPPKERRKFFERIHDLEALGEMATAAPRKQRVRWPDATSRRRRASGGKILPNLVLLTRELERY